MNEKIERICTVCGIHKPLDEFYVDIRGQYGHFAKCKLCCNAQKREYRKTKQRMGFETNKRIQREYRNVRVHAEIGGKEYHFCSKLEYRYAQHLEFCRLAGLITTWEYETHTFRFTKAGVKQYTPDFVVRNNDDTFEYHETKGHVTKFDIDKLKAVWEEYPDSKMILIFWRKPKLSTQKRMKLERYCTRVIWDAAKLVKNEPIDLS